jgi:hypothetical protein
MTPFLAAPAFDGDDPAAHLWRVERLLEKLGLGASSRLAEARYGVLLARVAAEEVRQERRVRGVAP